MYLAFVLYVVETDRSVLLSLSVTLRLLPALVSSKTLSQQRRVTECWLLSSSSTDSTRSRTRLVRRVTRLLSAAPANRTFSHSLSVIVSYSMLLPSLIVRDNGLTMTPLLSCRNSSLLPPRKGPGFDEFRRPRRNHLQPVHQPHRPRRPQVEVLSRL